MELSLGNLKHFYNQNRAAFSGILNLMEKGGGERLRFGETPEVPRDGLVNPEPLAEPDYLRPVPGRELGPAPDVTPNNQPVLGEQEIASQPVFFESDLTTEVPVSDLTDFEERMAATMDTK